MAVPSPPTAAVSDIRATSAVIDVIDGNNGGKTIDARTIYVDTGYTAMNGPGMGARSINSDGLTTVTGLAANTTYYYWADTHNADGWSDLSPMRSFKTYANWTLPAAPKGPILTVRSATTIELDWGGDGEDYGHPIDAREYWGSSTTTPENVRAYAANYQWTGLAAGTTYYFWAKNRTRVGWSGFSARTSITTWRVPDAPDAPVISSITHNSVKVSFTGNGDGGAAIDDWQVGYGTSSSAPSTYVDYPSAAITISGLAAGTTYYFWSRGHNSVGWSPLSARTTAKTGSVPPAPSTPVISNVTQNSVRVDFNSNGDGGLPIDDWQVGYGLSSTGPTTYVDYPSAAITITGLDPGQRYYFWSRGHNAAGWSALSGRALVDLVAGAYVNVNGVWKRAVPYVRVAGVWKLARPWTKIAGVWKENHS